MSVNNNGGEENRVAFIALSARVSANIVDYILSTQDNATIALKDLTDEVEKAINFGINRMVEQGLATLEDDKITIDPIRVMLRSLRYHEQQ